MSILKGFLFGMIVAAIVAPALGTDYFVGDDAGWKLGVNYTTWAEAKEFYVGDRLIFKYGKDVHNVYKVDGTAFQQCTVPSGIEALISGNDTITLATPGRKWYICGKGNHCASGMKLVITVSSTGAPAMAPAPTDGTSAASGIVYHWFQSWLWMLAAVAFSKLFGV